MHDGRMAVGTWEPLPGHVSVYRPVTATVTSHTWWPPTVPMPSQRRLLPGPPPSHSPSHTLSSLDRLSTKLY